MEPATERTATGRQRRADALHNRQCVLEAADAVFRERGLEADIGQIAARAGVGKATVYRNFPSRDALVAAVVLQRIGRFRVELEGALSEPDAGAALRGLLLRVADRMAADRSLRASLERTGDVAEVREARAGNVRLLDDLLARAAEAGAVRPDVSGEDLHVLLGAVCRALDARGRPAGPDEHRRFIGLVLDALRPLHAAAVAAAPGAGEGPLPD